MVLPRGSDMYRVRDNNRIYQTPWKLERLHPCRGICVQFIYAVTSEWIIDT